MSSIWQTYQDLVSKVPPPKFSRTRPRFSLTSDIVSYRRCSRQYGFFGNDGFVPSQATQIFYGTIIHQVLDRCHRHFSGLAEFPKGTMPTEEDIAGYFDEVETALKSHGIRPSSAAVREKALSVLSAFNRIEGPTLYPRVFDTEFRLESDRESYVLRGVVDVLASDKSDPSQMEIWDYKGTNMPDLSSSTMQDYLWQMCVYAELYRVREGVYPAKAVLYFLNELEPAPGDPPFQTRPKRAVKEITFDEDKIRAALDAFNDTAQTIIQCKNNQCWPNPANVVEKSTCDICDLRWNCQGTQTNYPLKNPI